MLCQPGSKLSSSSSLSSSGADSDGRALLIISSLREKENDE
jgi:hypothetical protein